MKTFGKYQLHEELGKGPSGITYRAYDHFRNRELAVKILHPAAADSAQMERLCRELAACGELNHPNIAKMRDMGEVDGAIYIATELLRGADLRRRLITGGEGQTLGQRLRLMAQVCDGLVLAHSKQIAHGNLKPSNIFITESNEVKILDFGLANLPESPAHPRLPDYLAPEQAMKRPADARSDVYSVAVVLFEFLVRVIPPEMVPLRKLDQQIPEELERLVAMALEKDPQTRLQTTEALAAGLCAIAEQIDPVKYHAAPVLLAVSAAAGAGAPPHAVLNETSVESGRSDQKTEFEPPRVTTAQPPSTRIPVRRAVATAAAAALGLCALAGFLMRYPSRAFPSPNRDHQNRSERAPLVEKGAAAEETTASPNLPLAVPKPDPAPEQILNGEVTSLWESGQYAQAMKLVDAILTVDRSDVQARAWKKKIRAAQNAEAELK